MAKEIFISYSRKDFDKVKAIKDEIDRELDIKCWMDLDGIESGEQFENKIISAIKDHDTMLFMLSANSMNSIYALKELKFAQLKKKRVILVYIESCQMSDEFLFNYSMYDTVEWANSLQHDKLLKNLRQWFGGTQQPKPTTNEPTDQEEQFQLGEKYYKERKYEEAVKWYHLAAEQGHAEAQDQLGFCYRTGWGVIKNYEIAAKWYRKAANQGYAPAQCSLGYCYHNGHGVPENPIESLTWLIKAAKQGYTYAQSTLGKWYYWGDGAPEDCEQSVKWIIEAIKAGDEDAQRWLENILAANKKNVLSGTIKKNIEAAIHGDIAAHKWLVNVLSESQENSDVVAVRRNVEAAKAGDEDALKWLEEHNRTPQ